MGIYIILGPKIVGPIQGGIKYFTSWEPILSGKNFARNSGSQTRQKAFKIAVIWVLNMGFTN